MAGALFTVTDAGRAALVNSTNTGTVVRTVTQVGISTAAFVPSKTLTALPHQLKRLNSIEGGTVAPDTIHITIRDDSADQYQMYGFGLFLDNGVLLGTYSQNTPITEKAPVALLLLAADFQFATIDAAALTFGAANFTNPPATETRQGVIELATAAEVQAGTDTDRAVTPAGLASRTATETRAGVVELATVAEVQTGTDTARAVTPAGLASRTATETRAGVVELATVAEAQTGADTARAVTPAGLAAAIAPKAPLDSPALTGTPTAPTPAAGTNTTQLATAAFVQAAIADLVDSSPATLDTLNELAAALGDDPNFATTMTNALAAKAPLASPALTGIPTAPTAAVGTDTTQLATTAFVQDAVAPKANTASPTFTGDPKAPTPAQGDSDTSIATTASVQRTVNGRLSKSVAGNANITLTAAECDNGILEFTGALTGNISISVPNANGRWDVANKTTGNFTLTLKTAAGTGVVVTQGLRTPLVCDSVNVYEAMTDFKDVSLTGNSTATTPVQFDNDTSIATTAFVQRALGNFRAGSQINAAKTLLAADAGHFYSLTGAAGFNVTLPASAGLQPGWAVTIESCATPQMGIVRQGTDVIDGVNAPAAVTAIPLYYGDSVTIVYIGGGKFIAFGAAAAVLKGSAGFAAALSGNGYQKLPSGLILQWGVNVASTSGPVTYSFPIAFANAVVAMTASQGNVNANAAGNVGAISLTQFRVNSIQPSAVYAADAIQWMAIGY